MGEAIVFTSGKGGVGKTTVISNIGIGLSQLDKKVVMLDTDMGLRNLDLVMGVEDRVNYNLMDVLDGSCRLNQALIRDKNNPNLYVIPAALKVSGLKDYEPRLKALVGELKNDFDFCLIDGPAGIDRGFKFSIAAADRVIVVTTPHISAIRDAGYCIHLLDTYQFTDIDLIVNAYDEKMVKKHQILSVEDIEEVLSTYVIGTIPIDKNVIICQNKGISPLTIRTKSKSDFIMLSKKISLMRCANEI